MSTSDSSKSGTQRSVKDYRFAHRAPAVDLQPLLDLMASLRAPEGCPWDREQTFESLLPYLQEESAEYIDAVRDHDLSAMREELGDVLLQVVFHAQIARESEAFDLQQVIDGLVHKLWSRHPHVFGDHAQVSDASAVEDVWAAQKAAERAAAGETSHRAAWERVPRSLPPLARANAFGKAAGKIGFDFADAEEASAKVDEELQELRDAMTSGDPVHIEEEVGDLLLSVANLARKLAVRPDEALAKSNQKFERRLRYVAQKMREADQEMTAENFQKMQEYWDEARALRVEHRPTPPKKTS